MLRVALPNKGVLSDEAVDLVREAGYRCRRTGRELVVRDGDNGVEFIFLRPRDIAVYVGGGVLDVGITGRDLVADSEAGVVELLALRFGRSTFRYAVPRQSLLSPGDFAGLRIATSYARIVEADLRRRGLSARIVRLDGAVEVSVQLGVADAIADVVESGKTLEEAGLKAVGEPILESEAVLIARDRGVAEHDGVGTMIERLRGIVLAREYAMVEYDIPRDQLAAACGITPGIESPTIAPLSKEGWVAVKAMASRRDVNRIMDGLKRLGAKGIIITDIRTCRL